MIRIGIVGLGQAAQGMLPVLAADNRFAICAGADPNAERRHAVCTAYSLREFGDAADLFNDDAIDAVYIASPTFLHCEHVLQAAHGRKHVLLEKPLASTTAEGAAMLAACEAAGVAFIVGHTHAFDAPVRKLRELVATESYGRLVAINSWYFTDWFYRPRRSDELDAARGGGAVFNQGSHHFDILRSIANSEVTTISGAVSQLDPGRAGDGGYTAFLRLANGSCATVVYSSYDRFNTQELTFSLSELGTRVVLAPGSRARTIRDLPSPTEEQRMRAHTGTVVRESRTLAGQPFFGLTIVSCERADLRQYPDGIYVYDERGRTEIPIALEETRIPVADAFALAILAQPPSVAGGRSALRTLEVIDALLLSSKSNREVLLNYVASEG
jgi:phthalate 4,5-cis-dihydrodiol dehydrogenase